MGPKYEFTEQTLNYDGHILHQIRRLSDGELGGWIESENNLNQDDDCWVADNGKVFEDAELSGDSIVCGNPAKVIGFKWSVEEILEHETLFYKEEDRILSQIIKDNYDKYFLKRFKDIKSFVKL